MDVAPELTLLVGVNGAGKSSILQALGFVRFLAEDYPQAFFDERGWDRGDFKFRSLPRARTTLISIGMRFSGTPWGTLIWSIQWGLNHGRLYRERVLLRSDLSAEPETILTFDQKEGGRFGTEELPSLGFRGSLVEAAGLLGAPPRDKEIVAALLAWAKGIRSLELLSPAEMKRHTRRSPLDMGAKGERLAGFLAALSSEQKSRIVERLSRFYPIDGLDTVRKRAGWIDLKVSERYANFGQVHAGHMSDGFMRLLALCAIPEWGDAASLILLDEIEDGIEPHILTRVIDLVRAESRAQVIATSHSPLLANGVGVDAIRFISRDGEGRTIAANAADMPAFRHGSEYMGPGELWANTEMAVLQRQAAERASASASQAADATGDADSRL
jgi:hypothetical protein